MDLTKTDVDNGPGTPHDTTPRSTPRPPLARAGAWSQQNAAYIALALLIAVFWILSGDNFMSARNWTYIVEQVAVLAVLAVAQTFLITAGYIDLSVGSVLGLSCFAGAWGAQTYGAAGLAFGVVIGLAVGILNGVIFTYVRIPSFIVTLAMMVVIRAVLQIISGGSAVYLDGGSPGGGVGGLTTIGRFPGVLIVTAAIVGVCWVLYNRTVFGQDLKAMGGNERVVGLFGVSLNRRRVLAFGLVGTLVGIASIVNLARVGAASPISGTGMELAAISAVVLGGTPLTGGYGSIAKTVVGATALTVLDSGLTLIGVPPSWNDMVRGALLIVAIGIALDRKKIGMVK